MMVVDAAELTVRHDRVLRGSEEEKAASASATASATASAIILTNRSSISKKWGDLAMKVP